MDDNINNIKIVSIRSVVALLRYLIIVMLSLKRLDHIINNKHEPRTTRTKN